MRGTTWKYPSQYLISVSISNKNGDMLVSILTTISISDVNDT